MVGLAIRVTEAKYGGDVQPDRADAGEAHVMAFFAELDGGDDPCFVSGAESRRGSRST